MGAIRQPKNLLVFACPTWGSDDKWQVCSFTPNGKWKSVMGGFEKEEAHRIAHAIRHFERDLERQKQCAMKKRRRTNA